MAMPIRLCRALGVFVPLIASSAAMAGQNYRSTGMTAYAQWVSDGPCGSRAVSVWAFENLYQSEPGAPALQKVVQVNTFGYDTCTGVYSGRQGQLSDADVQLAAGLARASASASLELCEVFSPPFDCRPVSVSIRWTGEGEVFRSLMSIFNFGFGHYFSKGTSSSRNATAEGTMDDGGESLISGTSTWGYLSSSGLHNFWKQ
jgi:hypothetical protein